MPDALAQTLPPVAYADLPGLRMAYWEVARGQGVPIVFCHGFPELAFSWRHQLKACEAAGRWAIAPDQRGYGLTGGPPEVEAYDIEHLTGDLVALLDTLGIEKAVFCGHDWGGIVVWQMPLRHPERTAGVIGVNTPFMPRPPADPIAIMRARMGEEMYIVHFQKPGEADEILGRDAAKTMDFMLRKPPPGQAPSAGLNSQRAPDGGSVFPLVRMIQAYDPAADTRERFLSEAEFQVFAETFQRTGFTGGINWYRNFTRNWERSADLPQTVTCPALMIMAEHDGVLPPSAADGMEQWVPNLDRVLIRDSGHWTQQEQPEATSRAVLDWMARHFPQT